MQERTRRAGLGVVVLALTALAALPPTVATASHQQVGGSVTFHRGEFGDGSSWDRGYPGRHVPCSTASCSVDVRITRQRDYDLAVSACGKTVDVVYPGPTDCGKAGEWGVTAEIGFLDGNGNHVDHHGVVVHVNILPPTRPNTDLAISLKLPQSARSHVWTPYEFFISNRGSFPHSVASGSIYWEVWTVPGRFLWHGSGGACNATSGNPASWTCSFDLALGWGLVWIGQFKEGPPVKQLCVRGTVSVAPPIIDPKPDNNTATGCVPIAGRVGFDAFPRAHSKGAPRAAAATPVADYEFQDTLSSSQGSAPPLTEFSRYGSASGYVTDDTLGEDRKAWAYPEGNGLILEGANGLIGGSYSIAMLLKPSELVPDQKLVDFRGGASDNGLYVNESGVQAVGCNASSTSNPITSGTWTQIVMTRDASKKVRLYVNDAQVAAGDDTGDACTLGPSSALRFFHDDFQSCPEGANTCEEASGSVARLRLYDRALTRQEAEGLAPLPGSEPIPPPESSDGVTYLRSVSLKLKKHLVARGAVTVPGGVARCAKRVRVRIARKARSGGFKVIARTTTTKAGTFKEKLRDRPGVYRARVAEVKARGSNTCEAASSRTRRHRH